MPNVCVQMYVTKEPGLLSCGGNVVIMSASSNTLGYAQTKDLMVILQLRM